MKNRQNYSKLSAYKIIKKKEKKTTRDNHILDILGVPRIKNVTT